MKHLIGLTGKKGSGKDTAFELLSTIVQPLVIERIGFADEVYEDISKLVQKPVWWIKENKHMFRLMLQGYGTDFCRCYYGHDYWIERWVEKFHKSTAQVVIVNDVRFINEAAFIGRMHGEVWRINRDLKNTDKHVSENELDEFSFTTIENTGSKQQLLENLAKQWTRYLATHPTP